MIQLIKGSGNAEVLAKIKGLTELTIKGVRNGSHKSGQSFVVITSREIRRKPRRGNVYIIKTKFGGRRRHVASLPGEAHANITGKLRRSLSFDPGSAFLEVGYGVDPGLDTPKYGKFLELGTKKMKARPSIQNGIELSQNIMVNHFEDEIAALIS